MDRRNEAAQSREGLLRSYERGERAPMRKSLENAYRSDSESDIDATEFLDRDPLNEQSQPAVEAYGPSKQLASIHRLFTD